MSFRNFPWFSTRLAASRADIAANTGSIVLQWRSWGRARTAEPTRPSPLLFQPLEEQSGKRGVGGAQAAGVGWSTWPRRIKSHHLHIENGQRRNHHYSSFNSNHFSICSSSLPLPSQVVHEEGWVCAAHKGPSLPPTLVRVFASVWRSSERVWKICAYVYLRGQGNITSPLLLV